MAPGAEAVLFADRAEMLACLAADWSAGQLNARWWWRALLQDVGAARAVLRAWLKAPEYIAAALDELACRHGATPFVSRLAEADTRALLDAVILQHDLKWLAAPLERFTRGTRSQPTSVKNDDGSVGDEEADLDAPSFGAVPRAPWAERVPESRLRPLRVDQQCLLGIALMTRRAPTVVRTRRFAADVRRWFGCSDGDGSTWPRASDPEPAAVRHQPEIERRVLMGGAPADDEPSGARTIAGDPPRNPVVRTMRVSAHRLKTNESVLDAAPVGHFRPQETHSPSTGGAAISESAARALEPHECRLERAVATESAEPLLGHKQVDPAELATRANEQSGERLTASVDKPVRSIAQSDPRPPAASVPLSPFGRPAATSSTSDERREADQERVIAAPLAPNESPARFPVPRIYPVSIETEVGGVFYLLNVALRLGLYGDFTTPSQPGIDLSIWDFLTLAGRGLTPRRFRRDPVWVLFADLAGRAPEEMPGAAWEPPKVWRVPAQWLDAFPEGGTWQWWEGAGRLRAVHPAGFAIVDVPHAGDDDVVEQVERELSAYRSFTSFVTTRVAPSPGSWSALTWWMGCLMPYVRARLARALGTSVPRRAGALLCVAALPRDHDSDARGRVLPAGRVAD